MRLKTNFNTTSAHLRQTINGWFFVRKCRPLLHDTQQPIPYELKIVHSRPTWVTEDRLPVDCANPIILGADLTKEIYIAAESFS